MHGPTMSSVRTASSDLHPIVSNSDFAELEATYSISTANGMSEALTVALYFLISREIGGNGLFPGNSFFYDSIDDQSYAPSIADMTIWASTTAHCKSEAFNHCNGDVIVWRYFWPELGKYFGLEVSKARRRWDTVVDFATI